MESNRIKHIIYEELPKMMKENEEIRDFIINIGKEEFSDKDTANSKFNNLLNELKIQRLEWNKKWEENNERLKEMHEEIKLIAQKHDSTIGALGARWGLNTEKSFRNALKSILESSFDIKVENVNIFDRKGEVFGRPEQIELDIIIRNSILIICEIKSSISKSEMYMFYKKAQYYENFHNVKADRYIVISPMIERDAYEVAEDLGIDCFSYAEDVEDI